MLLTERLPPMLETPQIVETDEQLTAVIHLTVARAEISQVMGPAIEEIITTLTAQGSAPTGPCFSYHGKRPRDTFDFEVGFPICHPITPAGRVRMSRLPAAKVVRTHYRGSYEGLGVAWSEFCAWMAAEGLRAQERLWESYTVGPASSSDADQWCTELNRPLV
jgi:effector-binding domain-containing protein